MTGSEEVQNKFWSSKISEHFVIRNVNFLFFLEQEAVMRLMKTLASEPIHEGTIDPNYTGQQHPDRYLLGKYKVHHPGTTQMHVHVKKHFPKKSHFKAHPAWLNAR